MSECLCECMRAYMSGRACVFKWHIGAVGGLFCGSSHSEGSNEGQMRASITRELDGERSQHVQNETTVPARGLEVSVALY